MILSLDESIERLRVEILAQDWRLSPKRTELLAAAFACLKQRFKSRKGLAAILAMAESVVVFIQKRGESSPPPEAIDFLKEAMAHVVSIYEEYDYDPDREEELFRRLYGRFQALKQKVHGGEAAVTAAAAPPPPGPGATSPAEADDRLLAGLKPWLRVGDGGRTELGLFLERLAAAIGRGETPGVALLERLLVGTKPVPAVRPEREPQAGSRPLVVERHEVLECPPIPVRELAIGGRPVAVPETAVALVRSLKPGRRKEYLQSGRVPVRDLGRMLGSLSGQFQGVLATVRDRTLRKLTLPVMPLHGFDLPELPDETASVLVVLEFERWHGVLFCSAVTEEAKTMIRFQRARNGDVAGIAYLDDGEQLALLDTKELLKREGFLLATA